MKRTEYHSYLSGRPAKGCQMCVKGEKLVLFVTGICSKRCFFCPLSEQKKDKDVVYANEWQLKDDNDTKTLIKEAELTDARGCGITGGDPLLRLGRTIRYIRLLKKRFGKNFHVHLYTPLENVSEEKFRKLYGAGLDEIRLHPDLEDKRLWSRIDIAKRFDWDFGVEIPVIPGYEKQTKELIDFVSGRIDFLNLNELEMSTTNMDEILGRGMKTRDELSYGVLGSEEMALKLGEYAASQGLNVHYCTTKLKDRSQLSNRILRRAKNARQKFDRMTKEGMLIRGAVYLDELVPGIGYREKIRKCDRKKMLAKLKILRERLAKEHNMYDGMITIDKDKLRILTSAAIARKLAKKIESRCAVVEEYPTHDQLEVEVDFLN